MDPILDFFFPRRRKFEQRLRRQTNVPIGEVREKTLDNIVRKLTDYLIVKDYKDADPSYYAIHPLVQVHYAEKLAEDQDYAKEIHRRIADYYLKITGPIPEQPTLENLRFPIEAVSHLCSAGEYDLAYQVFYEKLYQGSKFVLVHQLGAWDIDLWLWKQFFPDEDLEQDPLVSKLQEQSTVLHNIGAALEFSNRLEQSAQFYQRSIQVELILSDKSWAKISLIYSHLGCLYESIGQLSQSQQCFQKALDAAKKSTQISCQMLAWSQQGNGFSTIGDMNSAATSFQKADILQASINLDDPRDLSHLLTFYGNYSSYLYVNKEYEQARQLIEKRIQMNKTQNWQSIIGFSYILLGRLEADLGHHNLAQQHFHQAQQIAQTIPFHRGLSLSLLTTRGTWFARQGKVEPAHKDLNEALHCAVTFGYRLKEAKIRSGLAWAHHFDHNPVVARRQANQALTMSQEMGYHWGQVDAQEILDIFTAGEG
jgi:tetratricopeptide (TPR) repeat protein